MEPVLSLSPGGLGGDKALVLRRPHASGAGYAACGVGTTMSVLLSDEC